MHSSDNTSEIELVLHCRYWKVKQVLNPFLRKSQNNPKCRFYPLLALPVQNRYLQNTSGTPVSQ